MVESVRPLRAEAPPAEEALTPAPAKAVERPKPAPAPPVREPKAVPGTTLDGSWDRKIGKGAVSPDLTIDLHGHNLATAYDLLDRRLEQALAMEARVVLLITGKPPSDDRRPAARGAIRAAVGDWLGASRHAAGIASVRNAHPRHGGTGALYIILRKRRGPSR